MRKFVFPKELESILLSHIKRNYLPRSKKHLVGKPFNESDIALFSQGVADLSDRFTSERSTLYKNYFSNPVFRSGYLLYFFPVNFAKVFFIFDSLPFSVLPQRKIRILDLGSGPGSAALAALSFYAEKVMKRECKPVEMEITLVDQSDDILKDGYTLYTQWQAHFDKLKIPIKSKLRTFSFSFQNKNFLKAISGQYDLILMGNVLNEEGSRQEQTEFVSTIFTQFLEPTRGRLICLEPALKKTSRDLQALRDELIKNDNAHVFAPCTHQHQCPLNLVNKRDWCHFYFSWEYPDFIHKVDKIVGNKKDWLATMYLVMGKIGPSSRPSPTRGEGVFPSPLMGEGQGEGVQWRVISNMIYEKGKKQAVLCGEKGRYHLVRLDRNKTEINHDFDFVKRGDIIEFSSKIVSNNFELDGKAELKKDDEIRKLTTFCL